MVGRSKLDGGQVKVRWWAAWQVKVIWWAGQS